MRSRKMLRLLTAVLAALALGLVGATMAAAQTGTTAPPAQPSTTAPAAAPTTTSPPGTVSIGQGFEFAGGTVTSPDGSAPRALSAYQAATFVQACCAAYFIAPPTAVGPPPSGTPVYRVDINGTWGQLSGYLTIFYANDGTTPYISFPTDVSPTPAPNPAVQPEIWYQPVAAQTTAAFNGTATLVQTAGVADTGSASSSPADIATAHGSSSSKTVWWIALLVLVILVAVGALLFTRRRRTADTET